MSGKLEKYKDPFHVLWMREFHSVDIIIEKPKVEEQIQVEEPMEQSIEPMEQSTEQSQQKNAMMMTSQVIITNIVSALN